MGTGSICEVRVSVTAPAPRGAAPQGAPLLVLDGGGTPLFIWG